VTTRNPRSHRFLCTLAAVAFAAAATTSSVAARPLEAIKQRGRLLVCANPNALPFSSKTGDKRGFELELGVAMEVGWVIFPVHVARVDCDIVFDTIIDRDTNEDAHLRVSKPYTVSGVAIAVRPGIDGVKGFADLKGRRVGAIVGSIASVRVGQKGLQTIPFTFEDELVEAVGRGEVDAGLATPGSIGYYNLTHKDAPVVLVPGDASMPEFQWQVAVGMRKADDALESAVNAALDRLLADGVIHRIYASYGIDQRLPAKP
jgi:polar amino acid transport system substrate-binding protein